MKRFLVVLTLITFSLFVNAQDVGDVVELLVPIPVEGLPRYVGLDTMKTDSNVSHLKGGFLFTVVTKNEKFVELLAIPFKDPKDSTIVFDLREFYNDKIYKISRAHFNNLVILSQRKEILSIGILTLPFKIRPIGEFAFDTEFNFNSTLNINLSPRNSTSVNIQLGAGIGSVGLNSSNSKIDKPQDVATLTTLFGLMFEYQKVQIGFYGGYDFINNQKEYFWNGHNEIWLGFGIGINLFNVPLVEAENKNKDKTKS